VSDIQIKRARHFVKAKKGYGEGGRTVKSGWDVFVAGQFYDWCKTRAAAEELAEKLKKENP
jgi:hypothetical protein